MNNVWYNYVPCNICTYFYLLNLATLSLTHQSVGSPATRQEVMCCTPTNPDPHTHLVFLLARALGSRGQVY